MVRSISMVWRISSLHVQGDVLSILCHARLEGLNQTSQDNVELMQMVPFRHHLHSGHEELNGAGTQQGI